MPTTIVRGAPVRPDFLYETSISFGGVDWDVECCCDVTRVDPDLGFGGPAALPDMDIWAIVLKTWCGDRRVDLPAGVSIDFDSLPADEQSRLMDRALTAYVDAQRGERGMIRIDLTEAGTLALRNLQWLAEWRRKRREGFRAPDPRTTAERLAFETWHALALSRIRYWHAREETLRYRRVPPPPVLPGYLPKNIVRFPSTHRQRTA